MLFAEGFSVLDLLLVCTLIPMAVAAWVYVVSLCTAEGYAKPRADWLHAVVFLVLFFVFGLGVILGTSV